MEIGQDNELLSFEFKEFTLHPFSENKIYLVLTPKKQGLFRIEKLMFKIMGIPKHFDFTKLQKQTRTSVNSKLSSF